MIRFTRAQPQPIGVDIGADSVKLLQVETCAGEFGESLAVIAAARQPLPEEAKQADLRQRTAAGAELVRQMLRQSSFSGKRIVAALPRDIVHAKNLRLPMMPADELQSAIEFEARNIFPFDTEQAHIRHLLAGEVRQGADARQEVIVLAARHADVDTFLYELHRCGAVVESLDFEPSAIYRSVERFIRRREDEQEVNVLVDIGGRRTQVVIGRGRDISFFKPIDIGGQHLHETVARKLNISVEEARSLRRRLVETVAAPFDSARRDPVRQAVYDATRSIIEDLAREVSLCLRYYSVTFRGQRPNRVRLLGGEAADTQVQSILSGALTIPVEVGRPLHSVNTTRMRPGDRRGFMSEWTVAFGLSLKLTRGHFGARDGKQRDPIAPRADLGAGAEVVDLTTPVESPEASFNDSPIAAASAAKPLPRRREAAHA